MLTLCSWGTRGWGGERVGYKRCRRLNLLIFEFGVSLFFFYFSLILFNLLAKAVLQYDPSHIMENQKQHITLNLLGGHKWCTLYELQDEGLE